MNPSLTQILLVLDARETLVGVDEYSAQVEPGVASLPRVGGLFNPSLEAVVALEPDLVALVPSVQQRDFHARLTALGIEVLSLPNITLAELLASVNILGERVGRAVSARTVVADIQRSFEEVRSASAVRRRPRGVMVLQREPQFVVGRGSFIDEMLSATGVENVAAEFDDPYPRVGIEWLVAAAPELILDATDAAEPPASYWSRWASLPAVRDGGVVEVSRADVTLPGPHIGRAVRILAGAVQCGASGAGAQGAVCTSAASGGAAATSDIDP